MTSTPSSPLIGEFSITQYKPATYSSPLSTVKFVSDADTILLDLSRYDPSEENLMSISDLTQNSSLSSQYLQQTKNSMVQLAGPRKKLFFEPAKTKVAIVTCGGVCPGLNNVIRGLVNIFYYRYGVEKIMGIKYGFSGLVPGKFQPIDLTPELVKDIHQFGGTLLGSSRGPQDPKVMSNFLIQNQINILICIGGDGTQKGAHSIAVELAAQNAKISVVGVGKTIDNDLLYLDRSFGFETAVQLSQHAIIAAHEESRSAENGIGIVKLMGRESGAIALQASLASGDVNVVLVPEVKFTMDALLQYLKERFKTRDHCLIVCAEGAGQDLIGDSGKKDASGNKVFLDIGEYLKKEIGTGMKKMGIAHSVKYIDPSYSIRGGVANANDAVLCLLFAQMAAHAAMAGKTDLMVGMLHGQFVHLPLTKVTEGKKNVDIKGIYWQAFHDATGSPFAQ